MTKTPAERVRDSEAKRRERGEVAIKVWVPDTPEDREKVRAFAGKLCRYAARKSLKDKP